ncbi:MAG: YdcF family protein [Sciscionella sp.]|nr:YdcF family protein [Sciscionella sp.]
MLGFRNKNQRRANVINRWRVRAGLRSIDPNASATRLVFCGGSVAGMRSEADLMARYARIECGFSGDSVLEDRSRSTWENVANAIPLIEGADRIKIVSNSPHAYIARQYLARQRPDLAVRAVRADDYRLGEWALLKPLFAAYSLLHTLSHSDWHP